MTIIEFYDKTSIDNIVGALLCAPEKMILIGDRHKQLARSVEIYREVAAGRGISTEFSYKSINKNQLKSLIDMLTEIVMENEDCVFDLSGGEDVYLVAVGIIWTRYPDRVSCQRFNAHNGTFNRYDADGKLCESREISVSVDENVAIYDGSIVRSDSLGISTYDWDFSEDFIADVSAMWSVCRKNSRLWNAHTCSIGTVSDFLGVEDSLSVSYERDAVVKALERRGDRYVFVNGIMQELEELGIISNLSVGEVISYTFKNAQIKRCLTVAGQILELIIATRLIALRDSENRPIYNDVKVGVVIDWDKDDDSVAKTINEIDVLAMKGIIPIFISCKNGSFDANELYKLTTLASRFGGDYAKKVLVTTELEKLGPKAEYLRERMEDMKIRRIENIDEESDEELDRLLRSIWLN